MHSVGECTNVPPKEGSPHSPLQNPAPIFLLTRPLRHPVDKKVVLASLAIAKQPSSAKVTRLICLIAERPLPVTLATAKVGLPEVVGKPLRPCEPWPS